LKDCARFFAGLAERIVERVQGEARLVSFGLQQLHLAQLLLRHAPLSRAARSA
jgi:hypothetical protein